ncbi:MAG: GNAT family N-acetyltransferase [Anaerolineales bacterium]
MTEALDVEKVVIRSLREGELPALEWDGQYTHFRRVFQQTYDDMVRGQRLMLVAVAGPAMVGQVFVQLSSTEARYADGYSRGYIYSLRVRPEWQSRGIGTRLMQAAENGLQARGFRTAVIAAGKDNPGARRLYERLGYKTFADDPGVWYFQDVNGAQQSVVEPCWVMQKDLAGEKGEEA